MSPLPPERATVARSHDGHLTEVELIVGLRSADLMAFGALFAQHWATVADMARSLRCPADDVDDVAAEVLERVRAAAARGAGPTRHLRGYLRATTRSVLIDVARRRSHEVHDDRLLDRPGEPAVGADERMSAALATLAPHWRCLLWRLEVLDESPAAVAKALGSTRAAVAAMAYRARVALREAYLAQPRPRS